MTYREEIIGDCRLILGDAFAALVTLPDNSVDCILTDPPYFKVKAADWDNQWKTPADFIDWIGALCVEYRRVLKPNGSLYLFASPQMAARVEVKIGEYFNVLNAITWRKGAAGKKQISSVEMYGPENFRSFVGVSERIIFAEHFGADNIAKGEAGYEAKCDELRGFVFEPLRAWFISEWEKSGLTRARVDEACSSSNVTQYWFLERNYQIPTRERYQVLRDMAPGHFVREYEDLRREYEDLRRPFAVSGKVQWSDVWDFDPVAAYPGKHECEKPVPLLSHALAASTRPGAVVLDTFGGSFATAEACHGLGLSSIIVERDPRHYANGLRRMQGVVAQQRMFA